MPTWRCRDFNAAIPIKKRKYFVLPEESPLEKNTKLNEQGDDTRSFLDLNSSDDAHVHQTLIGSLIPSVPSLSVGKVADKTESIGSLVVNQTRVKAEEPNIPIPSSPLAGSVVPFSSKLNVEQTVLKTHDIVSKGECQTEASACNPENNSPYLENKEPSALDLSVSKGVCAPHVTDSIPTCTSSGNLSGVNRSNWDLNTTMDAWEDGLDRKTRVKTTGSFFDSSCPDIETSSCGDTTVIAKPVSEKLKESVEFKYPTVTSTQFDRQVVPTCSLSLGLRSYPPIEKSPSLSATTSEARVACTSVSRPIMAADNVNSVNLRTVKSEVVEESAQASPINRMKEEVVGSLNPVDSRSIKAEPNNFIQSKVFNRKDGTLNLPHRPMMQSNEILDILASFAPNQKDTYIPHPSGVSNAPMSMNGMTRSPGQSSDLGVVHMANARSGHGEENLNASDVNVSVTEDKTLDDCKTSPGANELSTSGEEKVILSGKELREKLYSYEFEPECGNDLTRVLKKQVEKRNLYDDEKVQRSPAMFAEGNRHAECGGSETEQRDEKESQAALLSNTGVSTLSGGKVDNPETVDNISPASYKAEMSTIDNDPPPAESSEGSQSRFKTLDASDSFVPLRMERERLSDFSLEQRKYLSRGSDDDSYKFSRERYHGKAMRSPRLNFMPDRRRFSDNTESNLQDRDTKSKLISSKLLCDLELCDLRLWCHLEFVAFRAVIQIWP
uniref:Uncharacterized protein n=2 Tax=Brassica campestris TaxID=3711 RepID=M4E3R9_BRACM